MLPVTPSPLLPCPPPQKRQIISSPHAPSPQRQTKPSPFLKQVDGWKQAINHKTQPMHSDAADDSSRNFRDKPILGQPRPTNPMIWCAAIFCLIFSLLLIFFGIATSIIFLVVKPRYPVFDTPAANLNLIYFDSPDNFNGDFTFLANFTNPNHKLDVRFEYVNIELYFFENMIATQALLPFCQRRRETRLVQVHLISSLVYLPQNLAVGLQKQVLSNKVTYTIRGTFKARVNLGLIHYSYLLHRTCLLEMTSPPSGVLITRSCRTKR